MAKKGKNSGKFQQDAIVGRFAKDARAGGNTVTVAQAIRQGVRNAEYKAKQVEAPRVSFKFLATGK